MTTIALPAYAQLSEADEAALTELYRRGTPANTLRWLRAPRPAGKPPAPTAVPVETAAVAAPHP